MRLYCLQVKERMKFHLRLVGSDSFKVFILFSRYYLPESRRLSVIVLEQSTQPFLAAHFFK